MNKKIENIRRTMSGHIKIELTDKDGNTEVVVDKSNTFTDVGDAHVADQLSVTPGEAAMGWMAIGTSAVAFSVTSTALTKQLDRNVLSGSYPEQGTAANDNDVKYKATWATSPVVSMPVMA